MSDLVLTVARAIRKRKIELAGNSPSPNYMLDIGAGELAEALAAISAVAGWIEPQRNTVPATGQEFAAALRYAVLKGE